MLIRIFIFLTTIVLCSCHSPEKEQHQYKNWEVYRGSPDANQYSALDQVNKQNVQDLEMAWSYNTGGNTEKSTIECNPIIHNGVMYLTSPDLRVIALEAGTGQLIWEFEPDQKNIFGGVNRGVTLWKGADQERILVTAHHWLWALDARTGEPVNDFGENGKVDLRYGLGIPVETATINVTSPGIIFNDLIILGSRVGERYGSAPGHIRAYNVVTGAHEWSFKTIPDEGEFGAETWEKHEGETYGGANAWGGLSLDEQRGWVFAATGSPSFDFYGGNRKGKNLFGNCVIAIDAATGERIWHYQIVHHDLWDYDLPCAPNLIEIPVDGEMVDAVAQPTKMGYLFLLDRETGTPLYPVEERPVPESGIEGEEAWPTQPFPTFPQPYARLHLDEESVTNIGEENRAHALKLLQQYKHGASFIPPSMEGSLIMPGTRGGAEWSGASFDPENHTLYINANEIANILKLKKIEVTREQSGGKELTTGQILKRGKDLYQLNCSGCHGAERQGAPPTYPSLTDLSDKLDATQVKNIITQGKGAMMPVTHFSKQQLEAVTAFLLSDGKIEAEAQLDSTFTRYMIDGYVQFRDQEGYPASKPPWGSLSAIDLATGKIKWKVPLGEFEELTNRGVPPTGTQNMGGCVATAGGLVFIGSSKDEKFRAFDKDTGKVLWEYQLPTGGYATPSVYEYDGKQYIVIAAGGGGKNATKSGDAYVAFSLPDGTGDK